MHLDTEEGMEKGLLQDVDMSSSTAKLLKIASWRSGDGHDVTLTAAEGLLRATL